MITPKIIDLSDLSESEKIIELCQKVSCLDGKRKESELYKAINTFLGELCFEQGNRLVVYVDELDRCKPTFAVKFLERIKHYFEHENITFVFSVNIAELTHTIQRYYGDGFDAGRYLNRFFDYTFHLPTVSMHAYYAAKGLRDNAFYDCSIQSVIQSLHLELREAEKLLSTSKILRNKINSIEHRVFLPTVDHDTLCQCAFFVIPILLGVQVAMPSKYREFVEGKLPSPFVDALGNILAKIRVDPFNGSVSAGGDSPDELQLYRALFDPSSNGQIMTVGNFEINDSLRRWLLDTVTGLTGFSDF